MDNFRTVPIHFLEGKICGSFLGQEIVKGHGFIRADKCG